MPKKSKPEPKTSPSSSNDVSDDRSSPESPQPKPNRTEDVGDAPKFGLRLQASIPSFSAVLGDDHENDPETKQFMELIMKEVSYAQHVEGDDEIPEPHWLIDSLACTAVVGVLILLNTIQMGLEAEFPQHENVWLICENTFTAAFLLEMIAKILFLGWTVYRKDLANWLDAIIVIISVLDCWIFAMFNSTSGNLQSLSVLRVVRLARLTRVLRLVKHLPQLVIVIRGVISAIRMTFWIACVVFLSVYVGAIVTTEYIGRGTEDLYPGFSTSSEVIDQQEFMLNFNPYLTFGSMPKAMLTLFNIALLAEWAEVVRPISDKQPLLMIFFLLFLFFTAFGVMNVMVGMIVDNVYKESARVDAEEFENEKLRKLCYLGKIRELIWKIDKDADGFVGVEELRDSMTHDQSDGSALTLLNRMKIPVGLNAEELLYMLDNDGDGKVHFNEFVRSFFRLIESTEFQQICIVQMGVNHIKSLIRQFNSDAHTGLADLKQEIQMLREEIAGKIDKTAERPSSNLFVNGEGLSQEFTFCAGQDSARNRDDMLANLIKDSQQAVERKLLLMAASLDGMGRDLEYLRSSMPPSSPGQTGVLTSIRSKDLYPATPGRKDFVDLDRTCTPSVCSKQGNISLETLPSPVVEQIGKRGKNWGSIAREALGSLTLALPTKQRSPRCSPRSPRCSPRNIHNYDV